MFVHNFDSGVSFWVENFLRKSFTLELAASKGILAENDWIAAETGPDDAWIIIPRS